MAVYNFYKNNEINKYLFTSLLQNYRKELLCSQSEMAKRLNVSTSGYARYERGEYTKVAKSFVDKLCELTKKPKEYLLGYSINENSNEADLWEWLSKPTSRPYILEAYNKYLKDLEEKQSPDSYARAFDKVLEKFND